MGASGNRTFPALYLRDFRLLWIGQVISFSGTWMHSTAQGWLVYSLTKSPLYLGIVAASSSLPVLLFSLLGGVAADRFRKRNLLILTQALSMLPALGVGILAQLGVIRVWEVIVFVTFLGIVNAFDVPARQSYYAEIVERANLTSAIALNSAAFNGARIIGPVIAGLTIAYIGLPACFYLNALSFLAVIVALSRIKTGGMPRSGADKKSIRRELLDGVRFIREEPFIRVVLALIGMFSLFAIPFISLLPIFAADVLKTGPKGFGFLAGSAGIGALGAALSLAYKEHRRSKIRFMKMTAIVFPLALLVFALSTNYYLSALSLVVVGWALVSFLAIANSSIQLKTSDNLRGRVMSVYTLVFLGMAPIGNSLLGLVADLIGTPQAVAAAACLCAVLSLILGNLLKESPA